MLIVLQQFKLDPSIKKSLSFAASFLLVTTCLACGVSYDDDVQTDSALVGSCAGVTTKVNQLMKVNPEDINYSDGVDYIFIGKLCEPGTIKYSFEFGDISSKELTVEVSAVSE